VVNTLWYHTTMAIIVVLNGREKLVPKYGQLWNTMVIDELRSFPEHLVSNGTVVIVVTWWNNTQRMWLHYTKNNAINEIIFFRVV